jgi:hypothetical protein
MDLAQKQAVIFVRYLSEFCRRGSDEDAIDVPGTSQYVILSTRFLELRLSPADSVRRESTDRQVKGSS